MKKTTGFVILLLLTASILACGDKQKQEAGRKAEAGPQTKVLATVNGTPITEYDLKLVSRRPAGHGEAPNPETSDQVLQNLIRNELIYQKSVALGLDKDPGYGARLREAEAQLRAFQRQEMSTLYRRHIHEKAAVTDAEAKEYFDKNAARLQTTFHIWQLFYRGSESQAHIDQDLKDLKKGMPFEKVAARKFPNLPKEMKTPWDLGPLRWSQIPEPWQTVLDRLTPGQTSELIQGPKGRFWVIRLVNRKVDPQITFATEKGSIADLLRRKKADELYERMLAEMRQEAKITLSK